MKNGGTNKLRRTTANTDTPIQSRAGHLVGPLGVSELGVVVTIESHLGR